MEDSTDHWTAHLRPDERIVWSASASSASRGARLLRRRLVYGLAGTGAALIAALFVIRLFEALSPGAAPALIAAIIPLYAVFALTLLALALWGFRKAAAPLHPAVRFAATDARLISLDRTGRRVDELTADEFEGVIAGGSSRRPDLYILRRDDPRAERSFHIEHIERPLEAKAIIEDIFPEPAT